MVELTLEKMRNGGIYDQVGVASVVTAQIIAGLYSLRENALRQRIFAQVALECYQVTKIHSTKK